MSDIVDVLRRVPGRKNVKKVNLFNGLWFW